MSSKIVLACFSIVYAGIDLAARVANDVTERFRSAHSKVTQVRRLK